MTPRTTPPLAFPTVHRRELVAEFTAGHLTSDAGLLLLREADTQTGLLDALDHAVPDPRHPLFIVHPQRTRLAQRLFGLAAGYEDLNDHDRLRHDPLYALVEHVRRTALVGTELEKAEVGTIRLRLFRVAALVVTSVRRLVVRLSQSYVGLELFARVAERLQSRTRAESSSRPGNPAFDTSHRSGGKGAIWLPATLFVRMRETTSKTRLNNALRQPAKYPG